MRITIPDDLAEHYRGYKPRARPDTICTQQLERFQGIAPSERILLLRSADVRALEDALGTASSITSAEDLIAAVRARTSVTLAGHTIPFSNTAMATIERRAAKEGVTAAEMLDKIARDALQLMLDDV